MDPEALYVPFGRLIEAMPDLLADDDLQSIYRWLGRAYVLVEATGNTGDALKLRMATDDLGSEYGKYDAAKVIQALLYRALAKAEMNAPASVQGARSEEHT